MLPGPGFAATENELRREVQARPFQEEAERLMLIGVRDRMGEGAFQRIKVLEMAELGHIVPEDLDIESGLKGALAQVLGLVLASERHQNADFQPHTLAIQQVGACEIVGQVGHSHGPNAATGWPADPVERLC